ncbi:MAG: Xaa-Pro peptidase family protein [Chlamydiota bacterium]
MNDARIKKLQGQLLELDAYLIENPTDLLYLTGLVLSKGRLLVTRTEAALFVDGRYLEAAKQSAPCPAFGEKALVKALHPFKRIGFDSAFLSYDAFTELQRAYPYIEWAPLSNPLKILRLLKEPQEILALKKAAKLTWRGYQKILKGLKEGISEAELSLTFEFFCRKEGASGLSFEPIIAFGENSAFPHHRAGSTLLKKNQIVLIDIGAIVDQYRADMTRVVFFGSPNPILASLDLLVKKAQRKAVAHIRPGIRFGELDEIVREEFRREKLEEFYTHSLGHGIGLDTHEYPRIKIDGEAKDLKLEPGMVFTIEPGLYQPGLGGSRYEDMVLVTEDGHENFYPQEP